MEIYKRDIVDIDLSAGNIHRSFLSRAIGMADNNADHFGVRVFRDGEPVSLTGVTVQGFFRDPHGNNIFISQNNVITGNVAEVVLPQACYNYDGQFCLAIKLVGGGVTGTMRIVDGMVSNTNTSSPVAPTGEVPTYQEIVDIYNEMVELVAHTDEEVESMWDVLNTMKDVSVVGIAGRMNAAIKSDPVQIASQSYSRLVYAEIEGYSSVIVRKSAGSTFVVGFTAATPADGVAAMNRVSGGADGTEVSTYVPTGAKYIAVYFWNTFSDEGDIDAMRESISITAYNDGAKDATAREWIERKNPLFANDLTDIALWTDGKAINRETGAEIADQSYTKCSNFLNIEGAGVLLYRRLYTTSTSYPTNGIAFYDSGKTYISGVASDYGAEERSGSYRNVVDVPSGATFVRFTYWKDSVTDIPFEAYIPAAHAGKIDSTAQMINEIIPNDNLLSVMAETGREEGYYISGQNKITAYGTSSTIEFPNNNYMMVRLQASEMGRTYIAFLAETIHGKSAGDPVTMATGETKRRELEPGQVGIFDVPADCTYIAVSRRYTTNRLPQNGVLIKQGAILSSGGGSGGTQNSWYFGKKMVVFGASSEQGSALPDPTKAYPYLVAQSLGMSIKMCAIGGSCCAKKTGTYDEHYTGTLEEFLADPTVDTSKTYFLKDDLYAPRPYGVYSYSNGSWTKAGTDSVDCARTPMVERLDDIDEDADVIFFALSSNDWQYNWAPLGDEGDYVTWTEDIVKSGGVVTSYHRDYHITTIETTLGAVSAIFAYLKSKFPDALIIIKMTGRRIQHTGEAQSTFDSVSPDSRNGYGVSFREYVNALRECCDYYGMNMVDFYRNGTNMMAMAEPLTLFVDRDGKVVHLNEEGNRRAAVMVEKYFLSLR